MASALKYFDNFSTKELPDQITICSTIFLAVEDCDGQHPTWAFQNKEGKTNLSVTVTADPRRLDLSITTQKYRKDGKYQTEIYPYPHPYGKNVN